MVKKYRKGSAHIVVIAVLVAALVTALGWVFYQNYLLNQTDAPNDTHINTVTKPEPASAMKELCLEQEKLCFNYPEGWQSKTETVNYPANQELIDSSGDQPAKIDTASITSPDGQTVLTVTSGITSIGGACTDDQNGGAWVEKVEKTKLNGYKSGPNAEFSVNDLHVVQSIVKWAAEDQYKAQTYLSSSANATKIGTSRVCDLYMTNLFTGKNVELGNWGNGAGLIQASTAPALGSRQESKGYNSYEEAKKALESADQQTAFKILASAHYK